MEDQGDRPSVISRPGSQARGVEAPPRGRAGPKNFLNDGQEFSFSALQHSQQTAPKFCLALHLTTSSSLHSWSSIIKVVGDL